MRACRIIVGVLAGVVLNALVAFACLCWSPVTQNPPSHQRGIGGNDGVGIPDGTLVAKAAYHDHGFGVLIVGVEHYWVIPRVNPDQVHPRLHGVQVDTIYIGWPFFAFRSARFDVASTDFNHFVGLSNQAVKRPNTNSTKLVGLLGAEYRLLPDSLSLAGFLANTLLYAAVVVGLWQLGLSLRSSLRRRTGRCVRCAYTLSGLERCPECGLAVRGGMA